jgi:hypothetical protein
MLSTARQWSIRPGASLSSARGQALARLLAGALASKWARARAAGTSGAQQVRKNGDRLNGDIDLESKLFWHLGGPHLQGMNRMTDPSPVFRMDAFLRTRFEDFGLELQFSNLVDDFRIGQRRNVAGILVVRDRGKHPTHDLAGASLRHVGHDHHTARAGNGPDLTDSPHACRFPRSAAAQA